VRRRRTADEGDLPRVIEPSAKEEKKLLTFGTLPGTNLVGQKENRPNKGKARLGSTPLQEWKSCATNEVRFQAKKEVYTSVGRDVIRRLRNRREIHFSI